MKKNRQILSRIKFISLLFIFFNLQLCNVQTKCTDRPQCFRKLLFNFNFPQMNLFSVSGTKDNLVDYSIKTYGDFNNDLHTDFIALDEKNQLLIFVWNSDTYLYEKVYNQVMVSDCKPKTIYLYDANEDGKLDFTVWGTTQNDTKNCLIPFIRVINEIGGYIYQNKAIITMTKTSDPILIAHKFERDIDGIGFLIYMDGIRQFLIYSQTKQQVASYLPINWVTLVPQGLNQSKVAFKNPHWNTYMDLTGDCLPDLIALNDKSQLQFWVATEKQFSLSKKLLISNSISYTFSDINYDGGADLIVAYQNSLRIYLNTNVMNFDSEFCCGSCKSFEFDLNYIEVKMPQSKIIKNQPLHFSDIDINGYPDLLIILVDADGRESPVLLENKFQTQKGFGVFSNPNYNGFLASRLQASGIISVSFLDILENGILDIVISSNVTGVLQTSMIYNNFLCQNDYFIKGFGLLGSNPQNGTQYPSMSFYWVNSVNDGFKVTYQAQAIQSSEDSLQMPYTFNGLGRANNYVQRFTVGRNGIPQQWSPIIPNSQLGVFTLSHSLSQDWQIRIFSFPLYELIAVIIVTSIILTIFGIFLMYKKCKTYKQKEQPLEIQFIS